MKVRLKLRSEIVRKLSSISSQFFGVIRGILFSVARRQQPGGGAFAAHKGPKWHRGRPLGRHLCPNLKPLFLCGPARRTFASRIRSRRSVSCFEPDGGRTVSSSDKSDRALHPDEQHARAGSIVIDMARPAQRIVGFYNVRGMTKHAGESETAIKWTRPSCSRFRYNAARLRLLALDNTSPTSCGRLPRSARRRTRRGPPPHVN